MTHSSGVVDFGEVVNEVLDGDGAAAVLVDLREPLVVLAGGEAEVRAGSDELVEEGLDVLNAEGAALVEVVLFEEGCSGGVVV